MHVNKKKQNSWKSKTTNKYKENCAQIFSRLQALHIWLWSGKNDDDTEFFFFYLLYIRVCNAVVMCIIVMHKIL